MFPLFEQLLNESYHGNDQEKVLYSKTYDGENDNDRHITKVEQVLISVDKVSKIKGARKEQHQFTDTHFGNYTLNDWNKFLEDLKQNGQNDPIFIVVDSFGPKIYEGNHRIQAAIQLGWKTIEAEIKYFGHSERHYELMKNQ